MLIAERPFGFSDLVHHIRHIDAQRHGAVYGFRDGVEQRHRPFGQGFAALEAPHKLPAGRLNGGGFSEVSLRIGFKRLIHNAEGVTGGSILLQDEGIEGIVTVYGLFDYAISHPDGLRRTRLVRTAIFHAVFISAVRHGSPLSSLFGRQSFVVLMGIVSSPGHVDANSKKNAPSKRLILS